MRESKIEQCLRRQIEALGGLCWKFESPGKAGVPDRLIILPGGNTAFVETKAPHKVEDPQQQYRHRQLREKGCLVFSTVDSFAKVGEVITWAERVMKNQV